MATTLPAVRPVKDLIEKTTKEELIGQLAVLRKQHLSQKQKNALNEVEEQFARAFIELARSSQKVTAKQLLKLKPNLLRELNNEVSVVASRWALTCCVLPAISGLALLISSFLIGSTAEGLTTLLCIGGGLSLIFALGFLDSSDSIQYLSANSSIQERYGPDYFPYQKIKKEIRRSVKQGDCD